MVGRELVRASAVSSSPQADPWTILDAIIANSQSNIFLVDVGDGTRFTYVPLGGASLIAAYTKTPNRHAMATGPDFDLVQSFIDQGFAEILAQGNRPQGGDRMAPVAGARAGKRLARSPGAPIWALLF